MLWILGFLLLWLITGNAVQAFFVTALIWAMSLLCAPRSAASGDYNPKGQVDSDGTYDDFGE